MESKCSLSWKTRFLNFKKSINHQNRLHLPPPEIELKLVFIIEKKLSLHKKESVLPVMIP